MKHLDERVSWTEYFFTAEEERKIVLYINIFDFNLLGLNVVTILSLMSLDQDTVNFRHALIRPGNISYNINLILRQTNYYGFTEVIFYL